MVFSGSLFCALVGLIIFGSRRRLGTGKIWWLMIVRSVREKPLFVRFYDVGSHLEGLKVD